MVKLKCAGEWCNDQAELKKKESSKEGKKGDQRKGKKKKNERSKC